MTWLISLGVAFLTAVVGLFVAGLIANATVSWFHIPSREGASGYHVLFLALAGGMAGFILGLVTSRLIASQYGPGFVRELGAALAVVLTLAVIIAGICRLVADVPPRLDGRKLLFEVEFRFPAGTNPARRPTAEGEWRFTLGSLAGRTRRTFEYGQVRSKDARLEDQRWIVPAEVLLFTERGGRIINLEKDNRDVGGFLVSLPSRPGPKFLEWSPWLPHQQADGRGWPTTRMSYRFRLRKEPPPVPPQSPADFEAEKEAEREAEFAAIPADAPIERWFPYLDQKAQSERALQRIAERPGLAQELRQLALGENPELAGNALRLITRLPNPSPDLIPFVTETGNDLAERIRRFNASTVETDPHYLGAADVSQRFHGWIDAVSTLRTKCQGDFTPELKTILELSRIRPDSHAMRTDVCRVASYYLHQWAGIQPLPTDPKPR